MTNYSAHDIHRLDQAYPDALADIEAFTGDPKQKASLAAKGPEVFAAELTRDLAASAANPMSLAAWAAVATVQLMSAAKTWEDDTDAAWAKVEQLRETVGDRNASLDRVIAELDAARDEAEQLTAELAQIADTVAPTVTAKPTSAAVRSLHQLYNDWVKTAHERLAKVDELTAELAEARKQRDEAKAAADAGAALYTATRAAIQPIAFDLDERNPRVSDLFTTAFAAYRAATETAEATR